MSDGIGDLMEPVPGEPPKKPKGDLRVRTVSAVVMIGLSGTALWAGGWLWLFFVVAICLGVLFEWAKLATLFANRAIERVIFVAVGILYIGLAGLTLIELRGTESVARPAESGLVSLWTYPTQYDLWPALSLIMAVIFVDVGAYFAGRTIGGPKIAPKISPSKTWSGLVGGMISAGVALNALDWIHKRYIEFCDSPGICEVTGTSIASFFAAGAVIGLVAQAGDFLESWMKRRAGVKDSGRLIPGHGGLLDRVDGLIAVLAVLGLLKLVLS